MKIKVNQKTFFSSLSRIQGIVEKSSIKPITANALIKTVDKGITVSATDLKIGMTAKYSNVEILEEGSISVNARKLFEIIKEMPEKDIIISEKENYWIEITCGKDVKFNIIGLPPEDFPMLLEEGDDVYVEWDIEKIITMIELTSFSISRDETKINICGAFFEPLEKKMMRIVTTDGYRLSIMEDNVGGNLEKEDGFIIHHKAVNELHKILLEKREEKKFSILIKENKIMIKIGEVELFIRMIEKKFPDYKVIIPREEYKKAEVIIEKGKIKPALKRISIISQENNSPVVFSFKHKKMEIFTEDSELGNIKETLEIEKKEKKDFSFCINSVYLLDILNAVNNNIIIEYNIEEEDKPIIIRETNIKKRSKYIIMPMVLD